MMLYGLMICETLATDPYNQYFMTGLLAIIQ